jgi:hypothetical protein
MPLLTELEEFNGRLASTNISLLAERVHILDSVSFAEIGTVLDIHQDTVPTQVVHNLGINLSAPSRRKGRGS